MTSSRYGFVQVARALALNRVAGLPGARTMLAAQYGARSAPAELVSRAITDVGVLENPEDVALAGIASDFIGLLRRRSIIAKIAEAAGGFRRCLPHVPTLKEIEGVAAAWVAETLAIPVTAEGFAIERVEALKVAAMLVTTDEFARVFSERADAILNRSLSRALADRVSATFASTTAPVPGVSPGGIFYGIDALPSTGDLVADVAQLIAGFPGDLDSTCIVTTPEIAAAFNFLGRDQVGAQGGYIAGVACATSDAVPDGLIGLIDASRVQLLDLGVALDSASQAMVTVTDGTTESPASLWQRDLVSLRALQYTNWKRVDDDSVRWIADAGNAVNSALKSAAAKDSTPAGD